MKLIHSIVAAATFLTFAGCEKTPATPPEPQATEIPAATAATAPPADAPSESVTASGVQPVAVKMVGENRIEVTKARVVGSVLNVELQLSNTGTDTTSRIAEWVKSSDVYYIDDQSAKKVGLLTDDSGAPVAGPLAPNGKDIELNASNPPKVVSLKFPAPSGDSISLNLPKLGSFDALKVTR